MFDPRWLYRMSLWARNPPSMRTVLLVLALIAFLLLLYAFEQAFGWPDWLTPNRLRRGPGAIQIE